MSHDEAANDSTGLLGYWGSSGTFIVAIHADWPVYPCPPGGGHAMFDFALLPEGTRFVKVDDIDQCVLFRAEGYGETRAPAEKDAYYVAAWHEDLLVLAEAGLVSGIEPSAYDCWECRRHREFNPEGQQLYIELDGQKIPVPMPERPEEDSDEDDYADLSWAYVRPERSVGLTATGWAKVDQLLGGSIEYPRELDYLKYLIETGRFDTAVREVAVTVESTLRRELGSVRSGQQLVEEFVTALEVRGVTRSVRSALRLRLRSYFKFIRNEYAHERVQVSRARALALMVHGLELLTEITGIEPAQE